MIDFGSVRHVIPSDLGGSTVVGTSGYMAPEQLMGRADTSSDLYGLGMTLIHLISGKHPDDLEKKRMQIQWSDYRGKLSDAFVDFVNQLTEVHAENRFENAEEAHDILLKPIGPPKNLIHNGRAWVNISWNKDNSELSVRGTHIMILGRQEFTPARAFFVATLLAPALILFRLELLGFLLFFILTCLILFGFISSVHLEMRRINATIRYTERGIEMSGGKNLILLSKTDQCKLDDEMDKLSFRYLEQVKKE